MIKLYPVEYIYVHHTGVSYKANADQWGATNLDHQKRFNMISSFGRYCGYNYTISANGFVRQARQEGEETAAVIGFNKKSVSICLDGNFTQENPTEEQLNSLIPLIISVINRHDVPIDHVLPHRCSYDLRHTPREKDCYGANLSDTWAQDLIVHWKGVTFGSSKDTSKNEC